jgi:hypothetical protein
MTSQSIGTLLEREDEDCTDSESEEGKESDELVDERDDLDDKDFDVSDTSRYDIELTEVDESETLVSLTDDVLNPILVLLEEDVDLELEEEVDLELDETSEVLDVDSDDESLDLERDENEELLEFDERLLELFDDLLD